MFTLIDSFDGTIVGMTEDVTAVLADPEHPAHSYVIGNLVVVPGIIDANEAREQAREIKEDLISTDDILYEQDRHAEGV